jgi:DNA-binding MarR family transcriptional regulator
MDKTKEAFENVRLDIDFLAQELYRLRQDMGELKQKLNEISSKINSFDSTHRHINQTTSTHPSTHNLSLEPLNSQNMPTSTGNQGVSTDRQTDKQTDQHTQNPIENASEILDSLDNIKKEVRLKFKRLTEQEWLIFSTIYQLEEEHEFVDYKVVSQRLGLTESSIRDYVRRLIKKGIPVDKKKINNKNIQLSISPHLRKIAPLNTILQLRGL